TDFTRFAYYTAWRKNEIATLEWRDIQGDTIRLRSEVSKNSESRLVIVSGEIAALIQRRRVERRDLFPLVFHNNGKKIGGSYFDRTWRKAAQQAGLTGRLFHDLRRTAVRNMD